MKTQNPRALVQPPGAFGGRGRRCQRPDETSAGGSAAPNQKAKQFMQDGPASERAGGTDRGKLFRYNPSTRLDLIVHLGLGLAAVAAVICSLQATFAFCARLDQIGAWFRNPPAHVSPSSEADRLTNAEGVDAPALDAGQTAQTNLPSVAPVVGGGLDSPMSG